MTEQKITPCLWFNFNAEEAVAHYLSIFENGRIHSTSRYGDAGPGPKGAVMMMSFEIEGQKFLALNGGPQFPFTPAISLSVGCETQDEIDRLWGRLCDGGKPGQCGWLTDKFSVSWQIVPRLIPKIVENGDAASLDRVMSAVMPMKKLDIATLQKAAEGA